jgi:hypothetical protein
MTKERIKTIAARKIIRHPDSKPEQIWKALEFLERKDAQQRVSEPSATPQEGLERVLAMAAK